MLQYPKVYLMIFYLKYHMTNPFLHFSYRLSNEMRHTAPHFRNKGLRKLLGGSSSPLAPAVVVRRCRFCALIMYNTFIGGQRTSSRAARQCGEMEGDFRKLWKRLRGFRPRLWMQILFCCWRTTVFFASQVDKTETGSDTSTIQSINLQAW